MKKKQLLSCFLAGVLAMSVFTACGQQDDLENDAENVKQEETVKDTVKDADNDVVEKEETSKENTKEEATEEEEEPVEKATAGKKSTWSKPKAKTDTAASADDASITVTSATANDKVAVGAEADEEVSYESGESAFAEVLTSSKSLAVTPTKIGTIKVPDSLSELTGEFISAQGGYTDGNYYYQAFVLRPEGAGADEKLEADNKVCVVKYDLASGEVVQESEVLGLNHANDITYNSNLGYFVVSHAKPYRNMVTYLNPDDLSVVDTFTIDYQIISIDYNEATDRYVVGIGGGQTFRILDGNFKSVSPLYAPPVQTTGYTTQGVASDDGYIYFVLYNPNVIVVYDWEGNFVTLMQLNVSGEPENISVVGDEFYMSCGQSNATLYKFAATDIQ